MSDIDPDAKLFLGDPKRETQAYLSRFWIPVGGGIAFGLGSMFANLIAKKPPLAGFHRHLWIAVSGGAVGEFLYQRKEIAVAERDAQFYHYITLHPGDFPSPKKILFRDYLEPWIPHR